MACKLLLSGVILTQFLSPTSVSAAMLCGGDGHFTCEQSCPGGVPNFPACDHPLNGLHASFDPQLCADSAPFVPTFLPPATFVGSASTAKEMVSTIACVSIPKGKIVGSIYCGAAEDPGYDPSSAWCKLSTDAHACLGVNAPHKEMGSGRVSFVVGAQQIDGRNIFCAQFNNLARGRTRYFRLYAQ
jgi:hypothetical protein